MRSAVLCSSMVAVVMIASCGPRRTNDGEFRPKLISCPDAAGPARNPDTAVPEAVNVTLRFLVNSDGRVYPESIKYVGRAGRPAATQQQIELASQLAATCTFEPTRLPVRAEYTRTFKVTR